ncbi:restriction endonuclease subunit S [Nitrosomonas oligotropha]|uniref:Type I restriction enzyme, S subunit n=1 Tax=Nitrosomonas oligotropha TaxID=42354 RepID=A0A1H8UCN2_9PROT|nr:restriction endonuclease subunit S [Nitrosomonas oligotropha]SDX43413.1 type I restriction enzyme, S subunit [Nitrosomonas oligotropha]SEP00866.1 type I restriction enzyme, S subunit [Nitrosomonas oligotropha]
MSFPRYEKYKDSGVEWLGEVPEHWEVSFLKYILANIESGTSVNSTDIPANSNEFGVLKTSCVYSGEFDADENKAIVTSEYDRASCPLQLNSLIVSRMNTPELVGAAGLVKQKRSNLFLPDRLWQVTFYTAHPAFVHYWTLTASYRSQVQVACTGTSSSMQNLGQDQFRSFILPLPSVQEQFAIVNFLNLETAKIDELIAEQQRLIELLKEKRQAVISHAVTKGLNPDVPMKDSGVEWLGEVPEHWEIKPLKAVSKLYGRIGYRGYTTADIVDEGEGAITLSPSNMADGVVSVLKSTYISWAKYTESPEIMIHPEDIVMVKTGSTFGKVAYVSLVDHPMTINPQLVLYKNIICFPRFLFFILNTPVIQALIEVSNSGSTIPTMSQEAIGNFRFGLPPVTEQKLIVEFVDRELLKLATLNTEAQRTIDLLQERRAALISAAVTGQIDVRELALSEEK